MAPFEVDDDGDEAKCVEFAPCPTEAVEDVDAAELDIARAESRMARRQLEIYSDVTSMMAFPYFNEI